ncbi:DUF5333 domain-containing protein [Celeribacter marinus]|uniref:Uncharacterized protein n=1 Tax=Celeribacter marinus TaxID=1397108 RepID=A0A0P0A0X0_9RHOB|nr:DUF5333 domain-containing protein [Celeribacter marinus]ALI56375.1 hypothetical protein IMCC12053_2428 [Celeribacter marinus]SFK44653.1 hypothetical protein SAMN05444421_104178 [Celeribacter marinus]
MNMCRVVLSSLLSAAFFVAPLSASALPALSSVKEIDNNMLFVGIAIEIADECPTISARTLKGLNFLWTLKAVASEMGYSNDQIEAYVKSKDEKARIRAAGADYARARGVDPTTSAGLCALGEMEIAKGSVIGSLLRAK